MFKVLKRYLKFMGTGAVGSVVDTLILWLLSDCNVRLWDSQFLHRELVHIQEEKNRMMLDTLKHIFILTGMKIYFYRKGYMHAKTLVIDDSLVTIGSTNIDFRGFEQDFEINAFMYDSDLAVQQRDIFIRDQEDCEGVIPEEWEKRPRIEKAKESFARIFSQVL